MTLQIATLKKLFYLDPVCTDAVCHPLSSLLYQTLIRINHSGSKPRPELAANWACSDDRRTWSFTIAENYFHDGGLVIASDIAHSFARHVWPGSASIFADLLRELIVGAADCAYGEIPAGLSASDEQASLRIQLKQPYCPLLEVLAHPAMGIVRQMSSGELIGSGPMRALTLDNRLDNKPDEQCTSLTLLRHSNYQGQRQLPREMKILRYDNFSALSAALENGQQHAVLLERKHQLRLDALPGMHSTCLRDRWSGMLILNAAGVFHDREMRKDFHALLQKQAMQDLGTAYHADFIPADVLELASVVPHDISPEQFQQRWGTLLSAVEVKIIYAGGRGPLTVALDSAIKVLQACHIAYTLLPTKNPAEVYEIVEQGGFDIVARGWIQDYDDADQYVGVYEKQAPQPSARLAYQVFYQAIAAARHLPDASQRSLAYAKALNSLHAEYLCIPICRDHHRIMHHDHIHLHAYCRDPFDL